ncbi:MAG: crosslink repair DNA glycosylase YcaQ family protein [Dokdonella sp.]
MTATRIARISAGQARAMHLAAQGLLHPPRRRARKADLLGAIRRMQLLQIDTINVVSRSPYLVLHSRLGDYPLDWLTELLADGDLFEVWSHEACFAPSEDFVLHRSTLEASRHWSMRSALRAVGKDRAAMDRLLDHVSEHGAVKASDFERTSGTASPWWGWKDEKRWLEACFALGELMISRRESFQRVYDLPVRVIGRHQTDHATRRMSSTQARSEMILRSVLALGVAQARWIADYFRLPSRVSEEELQPLLERGDIVCVEVAGWDRAGYVHRAHADLLARASGGRLRATHVALLSPFDPVVWDRQRASTMFGFEYRLECYTPAPKRRYGYFCLPILWHGKLVGRLDAKAHRADGLLEVRSIHLEENVQPDERLLDDLARTISSFAHWHGTPNVHIDRSDPRGFSKLLHQRCRQH